LAPPGDRATLPSVSELSPAVSKSQFLPPIGSARYHLLLSAIAIFVLGPLGGVTAIYMNFSLGFFVGGQVLAGILGSTVTYAYGPEGKHAANYMQTMAASVASMSAMGVLIQAMIWLGLPAVDAWKFILYFLCIGMFGVGVGMLYTPILVDKMQLTFPSGLAVANILRALTDKRLLKRSVAQLGGGIGAGIGGAWLVSRLGGFFAASTSGVVQAFGFISTSTIGAGMIVGARIGIPALVVGIAGIYLRPYLVSIGWLHEGDPFRKIGFLIALGTILGAAVVDLFLILREAIARLRARGGAAEVAVPGEEWKRTDTRRIAAWLGFWGLALILVATQLLDLPILYVLFAIALTFLFLMINGIAYGISDQNPISSAFVVSVLLMAAVGLREPTVALLCASVLLTSVSVGCDMQQDRSTGWRLGTNRTVQFRYQVIGVVMGAVLAVYMAKLFMAAYPVLKVDAFANPDAADPRWQSAMTFKFVGAIRGITESGGPQLKALVIGLVIGLVVEIVRKLLKASRAYQAWKTKSAATKTADFLIDAVIVPSPYASSFGGFVDWLTSFWFAVGGVIASVYNWATERLRHGKPKQDDIPDDMGTTSLVGGGLIAGESLFALALGLIGLAALF
jgi:uncharacterized oligopeptide transporter (OPT) family protein